MRIIPALAGNTLPGWRGRRVRADHPRSRGEYPGSSSTTRSCLGSSPLSRGIRYVPGVRDPGRGIIPALAGNTRARV